MKTHWIKKQQKDVSKVFKPKVDYNRQDDVLYITWLPQIKCKYSLETTNGFVFDINEQDNVKGVEIFDFKKRFIEKPEKSEWSKKCKKVPVIVNFQRKDGTMLKLRATKVVARKKRKKVSFWATKKTNLDYWARKKMTKPVKVNFRKGGEFISYAGKNPTQKPKRVSFLGKSPGRRK